MNRTRPSQCDRRSRPERQSGRQGFSVGVGDVRSQDERRFLFARDELQQAGLPDRQLNGIGAGVEHGSNGAIHVFDPCENGIFVKESMVDGDVETSAVLTKKAVKSWFCEHENDGI